MSRQLMDHQRLQRCWSPPLASLLTAGAASVVGVLLFSLMMTNGPARPLVPTKPMVSWRVPADSGALTTVVPAPPAPKQLLAKTATERPAGAAVSPAVKLVRPMSGPGLRHDRPAGAPLELAAWQRPDPAPLRPRADLTGVRAGSPPAVSPGDPVSRAIAGARLLPETVQTWIGDAAEWVGDGLSSMLPSRDGLRAAL